MENFRLVLDKIQDCIEMQNGVTESQLKTIWNDLSEAITENERGQKVDTGENNALLPDVSGSLPSDSEVLNEIKRRLKGKRLDTEDEIRRAVWYQNGFEEAIKWLRGNDR